MQWRQNSSILLKHRAGRFTIICYKDAVGEYVTEVFVIPM